MLASPKGGLPGSALVEDLRSPPETVLLGTTFVHPKGATALMLITGDPIAAFRDLVDQAQRAGYGLQPESSIGPCWVSTSAGNWWQHPEQALTVHVLSGISGLGCAVAGWTATTGHKSRYLSLRLLVGANNQPYLAHLSLDYTVADNAPAVTGPSPITPVRIPTVASPIKARPLTQANVGSVLASPINTEQELQVAAGSSLMAPAFPAECAAGGFVAVLRVTGVVGSVVDSYAAQFARVGLDEQDRSNPVADSDETYLHATTAGGGDATMTTAIVNGDTYALVTRCQD